MCGVAAIFAYAGSERLSLAELNRIQERMVSRGPDGSGTWSDPDRGVGLGHRRLAIIDPTESGAQPMSLEERDLRISYNGEIYNYRSLRQDLEDRGHRFRSSSDTEVLLRLYAERGADMLSDLRGMFAFTLWDGRRGCLLLARDPYGIKPLYYSDDGASLRAASQVKALLAGGRVDTGASAAGHVGFFLWGHVPEPHTLYKGVRALPAGSYAWVDESGMSPPKQYANVSNAIAAGEHASPAERVEARERMRESLLETVRHHLVADVDVGLFLSAGLDSTVLASLIADSGGRLRTITLAFDEHEGSEMDEAPLAERVASYYGARHETVRVTRRDFTEALPRFIESMDQPTIDGLNVYLVSGVAAAAGLKVALSGLGGDELFGGYPSFRQVPRLVQVVGGMPGNRVVGRGLRRLIEPIVRRFTSPKYAGLIEYGGEPVRAYFLRRALYMPWELPNLLDAEMVRDGWRELQVYPRLRETIAGMTDPRSRVTALESCWYMRNQLLRDADWAGMAHSLEVRVPFVDWFLLQQLAPLLSGRVVTKSDLAEVARPPLPQGVARRSKTGFVVPVRKWIEEEGGRHAGERGLRGWSRTVYERFET